MKNKKNDKKVTTIKEEITPLYIHRFNIYKGMVELWGINRIVTEF
jgi:hypothetical protein